MKKILILFLCFSLVACGNINNNTEIQSHGNNKDDLYKTQRIQDFGYGFIKVDNTLFKNGFEVKNINTDGVKLYSSNIFENSQGLYYHEANGKKPIQLADIDTKKSFKFVGELSEPFFEQISSEYYILNNQVFFGNRIVDWADSETFQTIVMKSENGTEILVGYDKNGVYFNGEMKNYDLEGLHIYNSNTLDPVVKDKNGIWVGNKLYRSIDTDSFERIQKNIFRDKNNVFCLKNDFYFVKIKSKLGKKIFSCHVNEFLEQYNESKNIDDYIVLNPHYFISKKTGTLYYNYLQGYFSISQIGQVSDFENIDYKILSATTLFINNQVYFDSIKRLSDVDFTDLIWSKGYYKVEYQGKIYGSAGIDAQLKEKTYKDEEGSVYFYEDGVDMNNLQKLSSDLFTDGKSYYNYSGAKIKTDLDRESYKFINNNYSIDKNYLYSSYKKIYDLNKKSVISKY